MTLGNTRPKGIRSLDVSCWQCDHWAILSVDSWAEVELPAVAGLGVGWEPIIRTCVVGSMVTREKS
jgi:hypothetical protein